MDMVYPWMERINNIYMMNVLKTTDNKIVAYSTRNIKELPAGEAGQTWVEASNMPPDITNRHSYKLEKDKIVIDEEADAARDNELRLSNLVRANTHKKEIEAAALDFPTEDFSAQLAKVQAQIDELTI
jgi:hypothetical protein